MNTRPPISDRSRNDCVFCKIVRGEAPADIVDEFQHAIVIVPLNPVVDGHVLVIPRQHVPDFAYASNVTARTMAVASYFVAARDGYDECNLITSQGAAATQTVFHLHVHLIPRREGDGLLLPWSNQVVEEERAEGVLYAGLPHEYSPDFEYNLSVRPVGNQCRCGLPWSANVHRPEHR